MGVKTIGVLPFDHEISIIKAASWALFRAYPYVNANVKTSEIVAGRTWGDFAKLFVGKYTGVFSNSHSDGAPYGKLVYGNSSEELQADRVACELWKDIAAEFYHNVIYLVDTINATYGKGNVQGAYVSFTTGKKYEVGYQIFLVQHRTRDPKYSLCFKTVPILSEYVQALHQHRSEIVACKGQDPALYQKLVNQSRILNPAFLN